MFFEHFSPLCEELHHTQECYKAYLHYFSCVEKFHGPTSHTLIPYLADLWNLAFSLAKYEEARDYSQRQIQLHEKHQDKSIEFGEAHWKLGILYCDVFSQPQKAIFHLTIAIPFFPLHDEDNYVNEKFFLYGGLAFSYQQLGDKTKADELHTLALRFAEKRNIQDEPYFTICRNAGILYQQIEKLDAAEMLFDKCLAADKEIWSEDHISRLLTLACWASLQLVKGNSVLAEQTLDELMIKMPKDIALGGHLYQQLALAYHQTGRGEKSVFFYKKALNWFKINEPENQGSISLCHRGLGIAYGILRDFKQAILSFKQALKTTKLLYGKDHKEYIDIALDLANVYIIALENESAKRVIMESLASLEKMEDAERGDTYYKALALALTIDEVKNDPKIFKDYYNELTRYQEAYQDIYDFELVDPALIKATLLFMNDDKGESVPYYLTFIQKSIELLSGAFPYLSEQDKGFYMQGLRFQLQVFYGLAIDSIQQEYGNILEECFDVWLQVKGLVLRSSSQIRKRILTTGDTEEKRLFEEWLQLRKEKIDWYQVNQSHEKRLDPTFDEQINKIEKRLNLHVGWIAEQEKVTAKKIQQTLNSDEVAIEFIYLKPSNGLETKIPFTLFIVLFLFPGNQSIEYLLLETGDEIKRLLEKGNTSLNFQNDMEQLWKLIWNPVFEKVKTHQKLYLSLDGPLHLANPNVLINPITSRFLLAEKELILVSSTREIPALKNQVEAIPNRGLIIGAPDYGDSDIGPWKSLDGAHEESLRIFSTLQKEKKQSNIFLGKDATKAALSTSVPPGILHIATHGFFNVPKITKKAPKKPQKIKINRSRKEDEAITSTYSFDHDPMFQSGLALAGANVSKDGILTAYEAASLNLQGTELVVLSACETGLGKIEEGEGVFGLQRAFFVAGAKSIIMSLWKVPDEPTQKLFELFYTFWLKSGNKHTAFRQAQLHMKDIYENPRDWGGFILVEA